MEHAAWALSTENHDRVWIFSPYMTIIAEILPSKQKCNTEVFSKFYCREDRNPFAASYLTKLQDD